jgi:hypothetical protein
VAAPGVAKKADQAGFLILFIQKAAKPPLPLHLHPHQCKTNMKKILLIATVTLFCKLSFAQVNGPDYTTAIGLKFYPGAITVKHFVKENAAIEGLAYFWNGTRFTGLYEFHGPINGVEGLKWYAGPGAHIGFWSNRWRRSYGEYYRAYPYHSVYIGLDGVLGLDYKISNAPLSLSIDWQPSFNFGNGPDNYGFYSGFGGLGIRYTIK